MAVKVITVDNFKAEVLESKKPVLVDFWAAWCGPCSMLSPIVDEVSDEVASVDFCKVNVDEQPTLAMEYKVMSIPMLVLFKNGEAVKKSIGLISKQELLELVK